MGVSLVTGCPNGRSDSPSGREHVQIPWGVCNLCSEYQTPDQRCEMQSEPEVGLGSYWSEVSKDGQRTGVHFLQVDSELCWHLLGL